MMKASFSLVLLSMITSGLIAQEANKEQKLSEEQIAKMREVDPMLKRKISVPQPNLGDVSALNASRPQDECTNITYNGRSMILLRSSIIYLPKPIADRVGSSTESVYTPFKEFLLQNRGWITTLEITTKQASGEEPLSDSTLKMISTSSNLIISTFGGNQISYKEYIKP